MDKAQPFLLLAFTLLSLSTALSFADLASPPDSSPPWAVRAYALSPRKKAEGHGGLGAEGIGFAIY